MDDDEIMPVEVILEDLDKAVIEQIVKKELDRGTPKGWISFYLGDEDYAPRLSLDYLIQRNYLDPKLLETKAKGKTFGNAIEKFASGIPILSSLDSMFHKTKWQKEEHTNLARYEYHGKRNPDNWIRHYISDPNDFRLLPFEEAIQIIDKFGIETAKLHLIFSIYASREQRPWEGLFRLQGTKLIKDLNYDKRNDLRRSEILSHIAKFAWALGSLVVQTEWQEEKGRKILANIKTSRLWNVAIQIVGEKDIDGNISKPEEVYLDVTPGLWTESFLNRWGADSRTALYHYSYISQKVMSISAYPSALALRIAMRQSIMFYRTSAITVRQLLIENLDGAEDKIGKAFSQPKYAYELKQQWNNALITLENAGFEISYDNNSYPVCLRPESKEQAPRGYFDQLIQAKIKIIPPKPRSRKLTVSKLNKKPSLNLNQKEIITGIDIRQTRERANIKATILAEYMGKSRAWLSQKETGKRSLTHKEGQELLKAIDILSKRPS